MKTRPFKPFMRIVRTVTIIGCLSALIFQGPRAMASDPPPEASKEPIKITADKLVTDNSVRTAEFSGNVRAVQGDTQITADRLKLFYGTGKNETANAESGSIDRIEAFGRVRISFDNKVAVSEQAIYITNERKLILQGPGSKVISGQDEVAGSKITFLRNDGRVILDGSADSQVKAVIHPGQRGLN